MALASEEKLSDADFKARMLDVLATDKRTELAERGKNERFIAETLVKNKFGEGI
jgi:hypothetical protein